MGFWDNRRVVVSGGYGFLGSFVVEKLRAEWCREVVVLAEEKYSKPELVNLGSGEEICIRELLELIRSLTGFEGAVRWDATKPHGQPRRCLDTSRALAEFGWGAKTSLRDGIQKTITWFCKESGSKQRSRAV